MHDSILKPRCWQALWLFCLASVCSLAYSLETYWLPAPGDSVVGRIQQHAIEPGETFASISRQNGIGYNELRQANGTLNPRRLKPWSDLIIPSAYILPPGPREGVVINISEMRLYYYPKGENIVATAPVSIGRRGWETPLATTRIIAKTESPYWRVPLSIKQAAAQNGRALPDIVPPGPKNPLGEYVLRLDLDAYLIHGTNDPYSIGKPISSGCIRLYPEDVEQLFFEIPVGTTVRIINEPYKVGWSHGHLYFEAHQPLSGKAQGPVPRPNPKALIRTALPKHDEQLNWQQIQAIVSAQRGYPEQIL